VTLVAVKHSFRAQKNKTTQARSPRGCSFLVARLAGIEPAAHCLEVVRGSFHVMSSSGLWWRGLCVAKGLWIAKCFWRPSISYNVGGVAVKIAVKMTATEDGYFSCASYGVVDSEPPSAWVCAATL